jgi:hypothetical protein
MAASRGLFKGTKPAHALSYFVYRDQSLELNDKTTIHHKCFNVSCINPQHLLLMTSYEQSLHKQHTVLGLLDKMEVEFPDAAEQIVALRQKIKTLLGFSPG